MQKEGKQKNILNQTKSTSAMWKMYNFFNTISDQRREGILQGSKQPGPRGGHLYWLLTCLFIIKKIIIIFSDQNRFYQQYFIKTLLVLI